MLQNMQDTYEKWGELVQEAREERDWTRDELAKKVEVNETTISRIERGKICPGDALKWRLAGVLGVRMDRLFPWPHIVPPWPLQAAAVAS